MNSGPAKTEAESEDKGMLVATLAGAGILLAAVLLAFTGGDEAGEREDESEDAAAQSEAKTPGKKSAFQAREVDAAARGDDAPPPAPKAQTARRGPKRMVGGNGLAEPPANPQPPEFESPEQERAWWDKQLQGAVRLRDRQRKALDGFAEIEQQAAAAADPEKATAAAAARRERLEAALERSEQRIEQIEAELERL